jgi:hypothetical protein
MGENGCFLALPNVFVVFFGPFGADNLGHHSFELDFFFDGQRDGSFVVEVVGHGEV